MKRLDYFQSVNGPLVASNDYTLDARGRRTASAREDGVGWAWGYNDRGEVTSGARGQAAYRYRYDDIGNRVEAAVDGFDEAAQRTSYEVNALNQYTAIHHPDPAKRRVQGSAHAQAAIEAKASAPGAAPGDAVALPVARGGPQGSAFSATAEAAVGDGAAWRRIEVTATRPAVGVGGGAMRTAREGWQYFPPKEEAPLHDHDGNLTSDARWLYWWDGENRLIAMEEKGGATGPVASAAGSAVPKRQRLEFAYDGESRRVRKRVLEWSVEMNSWVLRRDVRFLYDGWSMIAEFEAKGGAGGPLALSATYAWGLDLSGTETGAGGVGGLLFVSLYSTTTTQTTVNNSQPPPTSVLAPCYDGNGNVLAYADTASGAVVARYEYDPFGQVMIREEAASVAGRLHHQFSTKYADAETGLVYYGFRYYQPDLGRWIGRDPIGEQGGLNLYGMVGNDAVNRWDVLGKSPSLPVVSLCGGYAYKITTVSATGTSALGVTIYLGDAYEFHYYNTDDCCPEGNVKLVQALKGSQGEGPVMDALPDQDHANANHKGGTPFPPYAGIASDDQPVVDAPGGDGGLLGHVSYDLEICAICSCSKGKETNLGCTTFKWSTKTKKVTNWSGPSPKAPSNLWNSAAQNWIKAGGSNAK